MKKLTWIFIIIGLATTLLHAQIEMPPSVISTSGAYSENENMSISWTLGDLAITTLQGENLILTQGFQQPFDHGVGVELNKVDWNILVYPNPIEHELRIQFALYESNNFLMEIQDVTGRVIMHESHENVTPGDLVILNVSDFVQGIYFLRILAIDSQQVKVTTLTKL